MVEIIRFELNEKRQREVGKILGEYIEDIEGFYNRNRIHSAINFFSPIQFEKILSVC